MAELDLIILQKDATGSYHEQHTGVVANSVLSFGSGGKPEVVSKATFVGVTGPQGAPGSALESSILTLSTSDGMTANGYLFGTDYSFPTGYVIDKILCRNTGATTGVDDAEVALRLSSFDGDYIAVGQSKASTGWTRLPVSKPLAFYAATGKIYVVLNTGSGAFGSELIAADAFGLGSGWSGTFASGFAHTAGGTGTLTGSTTFAVGTLYKTTWAITGRTAGTITVAAAGASTSDIIETGSVEQTATDVTALVVTPTSDFDGTVMTSITAQVSPAAPSVAIIMQLVKV